jgi:hypothetical protein
LTLSPRPGLAHVLAPIDRHHDSPQIPSAWAAFLESPRGHPESEREIIRKNVDELLEE